LQEFDLEIKDKKGVENMVTDHLSRIPNAPMETIPINKNFSDEHILVMCKEPWYADIVNYLATGQTLSSWSSQNKHYFFHTDKVLLLGWTISLQILSWLDHKKVSSYRWAQQCVDFLSRVCMRWTLWTPQDCCESFTEWVLLAHSIQELLQILQTRHKMSNDGSDNTKGHDAP